MTLTPHEFIRRFLIHVLPKGLPSHPPLRAARQRQPCRQHRARAQAARRAVSSETARDARTAAADQPRMLPRPCPCCGGRMIVIETFARGCEPKHRPTPAPAADQDRHLMMPSPPIDDRTDARHSRRLSRRQRPHSHPSSGLARSRTANPVAQRADRSFTPTHSSMASQQTDRGSRSVQPPQAQPRGQIPIAHRGTAAAPPPAISCLGAFRTPAATARG